MLKSLRSNLVKCGIYKLVNKTNGKYYVGSSNDIDWRVYSHFRKLRMGSHENPHLQNAWNLYGESNFELVIVEEIPRQNLLLVEQRYLDAAKQIPQECYNQNFIAGCGPGHKKGVKFSLSHIESLKISHMGQIAWNRGKTKFSNSSVRKMSLTKTGKSNQKVAKSYTFIGPSSEVVTIHNLKKFCCENNLTYSTMIQLHRGQRGYKSHKGWKQYV